jgi:hypothetical protein
MLWLGVKALLSGVIVAAVSEISKRYPGFGGLVASLPLVSVLGMIWLWSETQDAGRMADHATGTFWFVLPSLPMFLLIPALLQRGLGFWPTLAASCLLTIALYLAMIWIGPRFGLRL